MNQTALARAQAGDGDAFRELIDPYRGELQAHCYRILGSVTDAEDVLQEALLAAWRAIGGFDGRSLRAWLYRIATNRCLNYLRERGFRGREVKLVPTRANNQPAFGYYLPDPTAPIFRAGGLLVLTLRGTRVCVLTRFGDKALLARFGLPRTLPRNC